MCEKIYKKFPVWQKLYVREKKNDEILYNNNKRMHTINVCAESDKTLQYFIFRFN